LQIEDFESLILNLFNQSAISNLKSAIHARATARSSSSSAGNSRWLSPMNDQEIDVRGRIAD
jgi:hypothetical protein